MDIRRLYSSSIYPTNEGFHFVQFPSFAGSSEVTIYEHNGTILSSGLLELSPYFRCDLSTHNIGKVILASTFMNIIGVRIIDTVDIYDEKLLFMKEGELFSFVVKGEVYIAIIYTDLDDKKSIYTNFTDTFGIFEWKLYDTIFVVRNSLTGIDIYTKNITLVGERNNRTLTAVVEKFSLIIIADPLFPESFDNLQRFFANIKIQKYIHLIQSENIFILTFTQIERREIQKLVGFLGKYVCIIPDNSILFPGYLQETEARDSKFYVPSEFEPNTQIDLLDPRWHELRMGLLEFSYGIFLLREHIRLLEGGIDEVENLGDQRIEFQKIHMNMTLNDMKSTYLIYLKKYRLLIHLLKNQIS